MTKFDPLKAAREELAGMVDVLKTIQRSENQCEAAMGQAEVNLNDIRKLRGFCQATIASIRERINKLEEAATQQE